jgi:hypothetical protein
MKAMSDGHVEVDETFVGGKSDRANAFKNKTIVMGLKKRGGHLHIEVIPNLTTKVLREVVVRQVQEGTTISTDEWLGYALLEVCRYTHGSVNHDRKEWARGEHHTNNLESFWHLASTDDPYEKSVLYWCLKQLRFEGKPSQRKLASNRFEKPLRVIIEHGVFDAGIAIDYCNLRKLYCSPPVRR